MGCDHYPTYPTSITLYPSHPSFNFHTSPFVLCPSSSTRGLKSGWQCPESPGNGTSTSSPLWPGNTHSKVSFRDPCSCRSCCGNTWAQLVPCHQCCVQVMDGHNHTSVTLTVIVGKRRLKLNTNKERFNPLIPLCKMDCTWHLGSNCY